MEKSSLAKKILVIDDEKLIVKSLKILLEQKGFTVFIAQKAEEALDIADKEILDLIIADIRMPGMSGVEIIQSINEKIQKKNLKKIPIIFITGYADEQIEQEVKTLRPIAYLYKPFDVPELVGVVNRALD